MTALSFVWVHPYSQNSGCDIYMYNYLGHIEDKSEVVLEASVWWR